MANDGWMYRAAVSGTHRKDFNHASYLQHGEVSNFLSSVFCKNCHLIYSDTLNSDTLEIRIHDRLLSSGGGWLNVELRTCQMGTRALTGQWMSIYQVIMTPNDPPHNNDYYDMIVSKQHWYLAYPWKRQGINRLFPCRTLQSCSGLRSCSHPTNSTWKRVSNYPKTFVAQDNSGRDPKQYSVKYVYNPEHFDMSYIWCNCNNICHTSKK